MNPAADTSSPPITFSFLTSWGLLERVCEEVPHGTHEARFQYHHSCLPLEDRPITTTTATREHQQKQMVRGRGVAQGGTRRLRSKSHRPHHDMVDVDALPSDDIDHGAADDTATTTSPLHHAAHILPSEVVCVVHFIDHIAQRARTESFPMPIGSSAAELYDSVRWWLGDERIVLFDMQFDARCSSDARQGRVSNIVQPHQPIGLLAMPDERGDDVVSTTQECHTALHPMCTTLISHSGGDAPSTPSGSSRAPRGHQTATDSVLVHRRIACQRTTSLAEDVLQWAAVYTFIPRGHGSASDVSWGLPPIVVPVMQRGDAEEAGGVSDKDINSMIAERALLGAAAASCSTYRARQCYARCPAHVVSRGGNTTACCTPAEVLVGYPAFTVGDIVEVVGVLQRNGDAAVNNSIQITEISVSEHSGLQLYFGLNLHTSAHIGPFLCSQLGILGSIEA
jgi:hypothetical protein